MIKIILLLSLIITVKFGYSQKLDSTVYYWYLKDKGIDSIYYNADFYRNGDLKECGWIIRSKRNNSMFKFIDTLAIENLMYFEWKVGVYRYYYKNDRIEFILDFHD